MNGFAIYVLNPFGVFGDIPVWSYVRVVNGSFILELISVLCKVALYIMHHYWWYISCRRKILKLKIVAISSMLSLTSFTFFICCTILDCVRNCLSFRPWTLFNIETFDWWDNAYTCSKLVFVHHCLLCKFRVCWCE